MGRMTDEQTLLDRCKYYKGETDCPANVDFFYWEAEQMYVRRGGLWPEAEQSYKELFNIRFEGINNALLPFLAAIYEHIEGHGDRPPTKEGFVRFVKGYTAT